MVVSVAIMHLHSRAAYEEPVPYWLLVFTRLVHTTGGQLGVGIPITRSVYTVCVYFQVDSQTKNDIEKEIEILSVSVQATVRTAVCILLNTATFVVTTSTGRQIY
jgi:hypothetical protein